MDALFHASSLCYQDSGLISSINLLKYIFLLNLLHLIMLAEVGSSVLVCTLFKGCQGERSMFDTSRMPIIGSNAISRCLSYRASYLTQVVVIFNANGAF